MSSMDAIDPPVLRLNPLQRLHQALMPDNNPKTSAYWWVMVSLGTAAFVYS